MVRKTEVTITWPDGIKDKIKTTRPYVIADAVHKRCPYTAEIAFGSNGVSLLYTSRMQKDGVLRALVIETIGDQVYERY